MNSVFYFKQTEYLSNKFIDFYRLMRMFLWLCEITWYFSNYVFIL